MVPNLKSKCALVAIIGWLAFAGENDANAKNTGDGLSSKNPVENTTERTNNTEVTNNTEPTNNIVKQITDAYKRSDYERVKELYEKNKFEFELSAIWCNPGHWDMLFLISNAYSELGESDKANIVLADASEIAIEYSVYHPNPDRLIALYAVRVLWDLDNIGDPDSDLYKILQKLSQNSFEAGTFRTGKQRVGNDCSPS